MKYLKFVFPVFGFFLYTLFIPCAVWSQQEGYGAWWKKNRGVLTEKDYPLVSDAHLVFERVLEAADKRANRFPRELIIIPGTGDPWAICLKDGNIVITRKCLQICYQGVDKNTGNARLAFVIGHELAHLADDDFWHLAAFDTLQNFGSGHEAEQEILNLLMKTGAIQDTDSGRKTAKEKELAADSHGLIYASMAGFDPKAVVDAKGKNFFKEWVSQITGQAAYTDELHPTPDQRAAFLLAHIKSVNDELDIFDIGVRLYQLGKYREGLDFLERFREKYPCREVYNNLGLLHYQIAVKYLASCDRHRAYQFKLATVLDTETRAEAFAMRKASGIGTRACPEMKEFKTHIEHAIRDFRIACEKDAFYLPARVNLSSALIISENYTDAMGVLEKAFKINADSADDEGIISNYAIAIYSRRDPFVKTDMSERAKQAEKALKLLKELVEKNKHFPDAYYNLGRIFSEQGKKKAAREFFQKYIMTERAGAYADMTADVAGTGKDGYEERKKTLPVFIEPSPVRLGDYDMDAEKRLAGIAPRYLELPGVSVEFFSGHDIQVLVFDRVVEVVERPINQKMSISKVESACGTPRRVFKNRLSGVRTFVYDNFALDTEDGIVNRVIYFN